MDVVLLIIIGIVALCFVRFMLAEIDKFLGSPKPQEPGAPKAKVNAQSDPPANPISPPDYPPAKPKPPLTKSRAAGRAKSETQYTVTELLRRIQILQSANAGWDLIFEHLVPNNDAETKRLLNLLRGPHMFIPHVGLNVLEEECRTIAAHSPRAEWITAFRAAEKTMERLR